MTEMEDRLLKQNSLTPEQQKQHMAEQLWLLYYNQYLYDHGVITERERNRMKNKINTTRNYPKPKPQPEMERDER